MKRSMIVLFSLFLALSLVSPAAAQEQGPPVEPAELSLYTDFPSRDIGADDVVSIDLALEGNRSEVVQLAARDVPEDWHVSFRGRGSTVHSAYIRPGQNLSLTLRIETPADAAAETHSLVVVAEGEEATAELPLDLTVVKERPQQMSLDVRLRTVSGAPASTFRYEATLENESNQELSVNLSSESPPGFSTIFMLGGEEVTGLTLGPNQSRQLSVAVNPASGVASGTYPITITAQGGDDQVSLELEAEVTGQPKLSLTTPNGRLSMEAQIGTETPLNLVVENTGSVAARGIQLSSDAPSGWEISFDRNAIDAIPAGQEVQVTANITPAEKAVAGDYQVTLRASGEAGQQASQNFRITVVTSTLWGVAGIGLIAIAVGVVALAVFRYGRR